MPPAHYLYKHPAGPVGNAKYSLPKNHTFFRANVFPTSVEVFYSTRSNFKALLDLKSVIRTR